ncbi:hypothetical protein [Pseudomonas sp. TH10]|uniref:hypothetical protein n=1 Tax=Pseudomonas sp. TH10 TaxID=2796376 RepID=UPI001913142D|nr:hypothetical protein [Pseudomonas sp. TH10]MBK5519380.1 hypothetical protein [Pseudomonas sp. TH10]
MTQGIQTARSFASAPNRYIAENPSPSIWPAKKNVLASLLSAKNNTYPLHPIAEPPASAKPASLFNRFIHFFQSKKSTTPHRFYFYGAPVDIDVNAIRRSIPGMKLHIKLSKEIISLCQRTRNIEQYYLSKLETSTQEKERVIVAQDLEKILHQLKNTQAEFERLNIAFGKHHLYRIELNFLIDTCISARKNINMALTTYIDKQRAISTEKIKQICSESVSLVEKTEKLSKTPNQTFRKEPNNETQAKALAENIHQSRTTIENACDTIRSNMTWYYEHEFITLNNALTNIKEAARKLNVEEYEKKLAAVASSKIPRAKLKNPFNPTQSNC